jgi:hypothetical protein
MAAAFFSTLGLVVLIGGPIAALVWSSMIGTLGMVILAGSSVSTAVMLFAVAVIIDRLDKLVAANTKANG